MFDIRYVLAFRLVGIVLVAARVVLVKVLYSEALGSFALGD